MDTIGEPEETTIDELETVPFFNIGTVIIPGAPSGDKAGRKMTDFWERTGMGRNESDVPPIYSDYFGPDTTVATAQKLIEENGGTSQFIEYFVDWANPRNVLPPYMDLSSNTALGIPATTAQYFVSEEYKNGIIDLTVASIEEAMQHNEVVMIFGHSHGPAITIEAIKKLKEKGRLGQYRKEGGKVFVVGLAPAFGGSFYGATEETIGRKYRTAYSPEELEEVLSEIDGATFGNMEGDLFAGMIDERVPEGHNTQKVQIYELPNSAIEQIPEGTGIENYTNPKDIPVISKSIASRVFDAVKDALPNPGKGVKAHAAVIQDPEIHEEIQNGVRQILRNGLDL